MSVQSVSSVFFSYNCIMTLIKSISGIRGTIGGSVGEGLNPIDIARFTAAYATHIRANKSTPSNKIVVGRDARLSGEMVSHVVVGTLLGMGFDVVNIGLASTPTTELAVVMEQAAGGIILTASHNPKQWNALKLLNERGEFLNAAEGEHVLRLAEAEDVTFAGVDELGKLAEDFSYTQKHIEAVLALPLVDVEAIRAVGFTVAVDGCKAGGAALLHARRTLPAQPRAVARTLDGHLGPYGAGRYRRGLRSGPGCGPVGHCVRGRQHVW